MQNICNVMNDEIYNIYKENSILYPRLLPLPAKLVKQKVVLYQSDSESDSSDSDSDNHKSKKIVASKRRGRPPKNKNNFDDITFDNIKFDNLSAYTRARDV